MKCDVPGWLPDPSLDGQPRVSDPTTCLHGVSCTNHPLANEPTLIPAPEIQAASPVTKDRWSRDVRDVPETRPPRTSGSRCTGFAGDRVHRGEPLLLGVDKEYQITYRFFARPT